MGRHGVIPFDEDIPSYTEDEMETDVRMSDSIGRLSRPGDDSTKITAETR